MRANFLGIIVLPRFRYASSDDTNAIIFSFIFFEKMHLVHKWTYIMLNCRDTSLGFQIMSE